MRVNDIRGFDFGLGETADMRRESVRGSAADKIAPRADEIDRSNIFPAERAAHDALQTRDRTKLRRLVGAGFKPAPTLQVGDCGGPGSAAHRFARALTRTMCPPCMRSRCVASGTHSRAMFAPIAEVATRSHARAPR